MKLFGNAITDRQKASVQKNINMQIEDINTNMQIEDIKQRTCRGPTVNET